MGAARLEMDTENALKLITSYTDPAKVSHDLPRWGDYYMAADRWAKHQAEALAKDDAHRKLTGRPSAVVTVHNHPHGAACKGHNHEVYA